MDRIDFIAIMVTFATLVLMIFGIGTDPDRARDYVMRAVYVIAVAWVAVWLIPWAWSVT